MSRAGKWWLSSFGLFQTIASGHELTNQEYKEMKSDIAEITKRLELERVELTAATIDFTEEVNFAVSLLENLDIYFGAANPETKRKIIGSIFPEKLIFDGRMYRTASINPAIARLSTEKSIPKKEKHSVFEVLSCRVVPPGSELPPWNTLILLGFLAI